MVKLSAELTEDLTADPRVRYLVSQLVETLHGLGMEVVAEGVDDRARLKVLLGLGVDLRAGHAPGRAAAGQRAGRPAHARQRRLSVDPAPPAV